MTEPLPKSLTLNGRHYNAPALRELAGQETPFHDPLLEKLRGFLREWLDENTQITLKTSGSTGPPKLISIEKARMIASARMTGDFFGLKPGMKALLCLSPDFIAGKMMIVRAMLLGLDLNTTNVEANPVKELDQSIHFTAMVPLQVASILQHNPHKFSLISSLIIGGGPLPPSLEAQLQGVNTRCWHTYAMTETLSHVALRPINGPLRNEWFSPMEGAKMSLDGRGCLVIDAPALAPEKVITNDLAELDGKRFRILGRIDDVIISAGHKLHPALIEQKIGQVLSSPFFLAAEPHPEAGQSLVLYLEGNFKEKDTSALMDQLKALLEAHELPRKIRNIARFKYLESGKIDRLGSISQ
ncbi:MAG: AMP-binding protein [Bacteroides sp.]|jgi:O-succinylbenzoic acid--CoA ligase|nr:AMP-binding protein [Bacteroides sp.]